VTQIPLGEGGVSAETEPECDTEPRWIGSPKAYGFEYSDPEPNRADSYPDDESEIEILVHSAGILKISHELNDDGIEQNFAINYLSRFLLTELLLPALRNGQARIVNICQHRSSRNEQTRLRLRQPAGYPTAQPVEDLHPVTGRY
jgi:NAD(P)-dependent dehydrogenase (short-subunit alcohol dehydrogenase family)